MHQHTHLRRRIATPLLLTTAACTTLQPINRTDQYIEAKHPARIWVNTASQKDVLITAPRMYQDSIYGYNGTGGQIWLAMQDVQAARARQTSMVRTGLLFTAIVGGVVLAGTVLSGSGDSKVEQPVDIIDFSRLLPLLHR